LLNIMQYPLSKECGGSGFQQDHLAVESKSPMSAFTERQMHNIEGRVIDTGSTWKQRLGCKSNKNCHLCSVSSRNDNKKRLFIKDLIGSR
jgi:hypothetical protein